MFHFIVRLEHRLLRHVWFSTLKMVIHMTKTRLYKTTDWGIHVLSLIQVIFRPPSPHPGLKILRFKVFTAELWLTQNTS